MFLKSILYQLVFKIEVYHELCVLFTPVLNIKYVIFDIIILVFTLVWLFSEILVYDALKRWRDSIFHNNFWPFRFSPRYCIKSFMSNFLEIIFNMLLAIL